MGTRNTKVGGTGGEEGDGDAAADTASPVLAALLESARTRRELGRRLAAADRRLDADHLADVVRHGPVLEALLDDPLDRGAVEDRLDVSRATSHRFVRWLTEQGFAEKRDGRYHLTGQGEVVAEEVLRFEAVVATAGRMAPVLDAVCPDHREFVVEPFVDAAVTVATPAAPYAPVERFRDLLAASGSVRGFNVAHMTPPLDDGGHPFAGTEAEIVYLPRTAERLLAGHPERIAAAAERGDLALRTREALPYGLALFDERVAVGGYDEATGQLVALADAGDPIAREWAERVYAAVRADSEPLSALAE